MKTQQEIEQLAKEHSIKLDNDDDAIGFGFIEGYTQCQEDMADKKYTFNQITDAMAMSREINGKETYYKYSMEEIINSLNKQD
tara:strand:- start:269 stop:517 length:249 start_codon:yes stop_codon:yes gene_type:complete